MVKIIGGSFAFIFGIFLTMTLAGAIVGIPMIIAGFGAIWMGLIQMGVLAAKGGIAAGKAINEMNKDR